MEEQPERYSIREALEDLEYIRKPFYEERQIQIYTMKELRKTKLIFEKLEGLLKKLEEEKN